MELMTAEQRNELSGAKNAKIIRQGVYDVGILIGAVLLADKIAKLWPAEWPTELIAQLELTAVYGALALWVGIIFKRYSDWKSVAVLEKGLDRDELEREIGRGLEKGELKNLGLD